ncbi:HPr kinase [Alkaliphilus metalliredigens QYMF]|uniref:HPr kinase n=1 Tax=Alkaliphilus metalliredigens (strain QYMF) TaxID=293826 RepID=A6TQG6_ALKMQ|nr:DRTGG domain-containing protein [Alkaliphilus metalliredigens]ABR48434.1 HPr kinase [Alkaliphilus metalliredigens QYMF]
MNTVGDLIKELELEVMAGDQEAMDKAVTGVYIGDLLSWVMSRIETGNIWVTIQTHVNVVAVALLGEASCIIIPEGAEIEQDTIVKAEEEGIPLLRSKLSAYELAVRMEACGIKK